MLKFVTTRELNQARVALAQYNRMFPETMREIARADWPEEFSRLKSCPAERVWRSREFLAVLYVEPGKIARRLSVCRTRINDRGDYEDGISWDDLMRVKSQCGFADVDAVEMYPRDRDVVNVANLRHLWILPEPSDLVWRAESEPA